MFCARIKDDVGLADPLIHYIASVMYRQSLVKSLDLFTSHDTIACMCVCVYLLRSLNKDSNQANKITCLATCLSLLIWEN